MESAASLMRVAKNLGITDSGHLFWASATVQIIGFGGHSSRKNVKWYLGDGTERGWHVR